MVENSIIGWIAVLGTIGAELVDFIAYLFKQGFHPSGIALVLVCLAVGDDLAAVGIEREMGLR